MARPLINRATYGDAVLSRFIDVGIPPELKADFAAFKGQHTVFLGFTVVVEKAEHSYDAVAVSAAKLDAGRDKTLLALADKLPGAGLGARTQPFARFSKYAPSRLVSLSYMAETLEVRTLISGIQGATPPKDIAALCADGLAQNEAVHAALEGLTVPLAALNEARSKRDRAIPDWEKHFRRLKDAAKVAFRDEAGRFEALFAEPDAVLTHTRPKPRKAKAKGALAPARSLAAPAAKKAAKAKGVGAPEGGLAAPAAKKPAKAKARRGR